MSTVTKLLIVSFFLGCAEPAWAQWWWPPDDCSSQPGAPTCADAVEVTLGGDWPDTCVPNDSAARVVGSTIEFDVNQDYPEGTGCLFVITPWSRTESIGRLAPGTYTVVATWYEGGKRQAGPDELCEITVLPHPADVDESGAVGFEDVLAVLAAWGPCAGCPEDIDGDGAAGLADLLAVLAAWGACG